MSLKIQNNRIDSLDYLRGIAALGIMFYHIHLLQDGEVDASSPLARIKIYGVALFFILSGLTLFKVYENKLTRENLTMFYMKRIFRIVPLLWVATIMTFLLSGEHFGLKKIIVNMLVLPGMIKPEAYVANGAWSIGNEIGFYLIFPIILTVINFRKSLVWVLLCVCFIPFAIFTWYVMNPGVPLGRQWHLYVSPASQFIFFMAGILLACLAKPSATLVRFAPVIGAAALAAILFVPVHGEPIVLTTGNWRLLFSLLTVLLCYAIYISNFSALPDWLKGTLSWLGEISYSVYLLHPIVFLMGEKVLPGFWTVQPVISGGLTIAATLTISHFMYQHFEKYFMGLPQRLARVKAPRPVVAEA